MPVQRAPVRVLAARIAVLVEVGQHVDFRMVFVTVVLAEHVDLHLAEIARESDLSRRRQIDIAEQDQFIVEKGFINLGEHRWRYRFRQRDAGDLAAQHRMQRLDIEWPVTDCALRLKLGLSHEQPPGTIGNAGIIQCPRALPRLLGPPDWDTEAGASRWQLPAWKSLSPYSHQFGIISRVISKAIFGMGVWKFESWRPSHQVRSLHILRLMPGRGPPRGTF